MNRKKNGQKMERERKKNSSIWFQLRLRQNKIERSTNFPRYKLLLNNCMYQIAKAKRKRLTTRVRARYRTGGFTINAYHTFHFSSIQSLSLIAFQNSSFSISKIFLIFLIVLTQSPYCFLFPLFLFPVLVPFSIFRSRSHAHKL